MLNRIALCSVEWQYLLQLKPRSNVGNGDSLNHHHLNSMASLLWSFAGVYATKKNLAAGICCDLNVPH